MARKTEKVVLLDELAAIAAGFEKASLLASRFAADYERLVQYGRSAAPDVAALADRRREAWALLDEVDALVDDSSKAVSRFAVLYARVVEGGRLTASEV